MSDTKPRTDRLLIIGAGPLGLAHARALQKQGISYDHVEADDDIGGNWYHGHYNGLHTVSPKRTMQFPDYPMPHSYPDFPSAPQILEYLKDYADRFDLADTIELSMKVVWVRPVENNCWEVTFETGERRVYKGVIVCTGRHWERKWPACPGLFTGEYIHSRDYEHPDQLKNRHVLVVGSGTSACDIACDAARSARSTALSLRRGTWVLPKTLFGRPTMDFINPLLPITVQTWVIRFALMFAVGNYRRYGLPNPDHELFARQPAINGTVLTDIRNGRIKPRPGVKSMSGNVVTFEDETHEQFDMLVCATGYSLSYPFLPPQLAPIEEHALKVYGGSMLPRYRNLYLPGTEEVRTGFGPITAAIAKFTVKMVRLQEELQHPAGQILLALGAKARDGRSVDPNILKLRLWRLGHSLWLMRLLDRQILNLPVRSNETLEYTGPDPAHHKPTTVY